MTFRFRILSALSLLALVSLVACGKNETKKDNVATVPPLTTGTCPPGQTSTIVNGYQMCQGAGGALNTPIYQTSINNSTGYASDNTCYRSLTVTNTTQMQKFLREAMSVCNQNHASGGTADCSAWANGYFKLELLTSGPQMAFNFYAYPQNTGYWYSLPSMSDFFLGMMGFPVYNTYSYATRNPLSLGMSVFPINDNKGFEGRTNGDLYTLANRSLIQVQVGNGKPGDTHFTYGVAYEGVVFMTGTLVNSANYQYYCGY